MGYPPSVREICKALGLASPGSLLKHLRSLEDEGFIVSDPHKKRTWKLTRGPAKARIPLIGRIAAGAPILAEQNKESDLSIDPRLFGADEVFALIVKGDSMIDAQIRDGDIAVIKPQCDAENGEIVAVIVEGLESEATLKIFHKKRGIIELRPANDNHQIRAFKGAQQSSVRIVGKLMGIVRPRP